MEENNSEVKPKVGLNILQKISDDNPKIDSKIVKKILLSFSKMVDEEFLSNETKKRAKLFNLKLVAKSSGLLITAREEAPKEEESKQED